MPELLPEGPRHAPEPATPGAGRKTDPGVREAESQADQHANDNARVWRDEAALRAAQSSIVGAVRSAAADQRAAASQARTSSAKDKAAGRPPHPTPGHR